MASSDWKILVGVELDTSDIQSQLEKVTGKGSKVSLDTSAATKNLKRYQIYRVTVSISTLRSFKLWDEKLDELVPR